MAVAVRTGGPSPQKTAKLTRKFILNKKIKPANYLKPLKYPIKLKWRKHSNIENQANLQKQES